MKNQEINILLGGKIRVSKLVVPFELKDKIYRDLTFDNPKFSKTREMGFRTVGIPENIRLITYDGSDLLLPIGYYPRLVAHLRAADIRFQVNDQRVAPPIGGTMTVRGQLYGYQEKALADLLRFPTGVLEGVTGCGKTNILLSAAARLGTRALILVHSKELLAQMAERCRTWLDYDPGVVGAGQERVKAVTVGMIQTLSRRDLGRLGRSFGAVLTDEVHHIAAETWIKVVESFHSRYKYGFSGTAWRKDGLTPLIYMTTGYKTATITREECQNAGKIVPAKVEVLETSYFYDINSSNEWGAMLADLVENPKRNQLIAAEAARRLQAGSRVLILSDRIQHCETLGALMADGAKVVLHGRLTPKEREARMAAVRQGARLTISTYSLFGEGVDVPALDVLLFASPISKGTRVLQSLGRVVRSATGKVSATVVDFVDVRVDFLVKAARGRHQLLTS